jgi:hypothetical protein
MTVNAKLIVAAYYGRSPKFSYWYGCSTGGRQALAEAQRFPADYNGMVAGAPAIFLTHMQAASVWKAQAIRKNPGGLVPPAKLLLIHKAVLAACDARDGESAGYLTKRKLMLNPAIDSFGVAPDEDSWGPAAKSLSVTSLPALYILDGSGRLRVIHLGYDSSEHFTDSLSHHIDELL